MGPYWEVPTTKLRSNRNTDVLITFEDDYALFTDSDHFVYDTPTSYTQAMRSRESTHWKTAIEAEFKSLRQLKTYEIIPKESVPKDAKLLDTKFVFTRKPPPVLYKARLVVRGDQSNDSLTLEDTFSSVVRTESLRLFLTLILKLSLVYVTLDVKSAFLYATLPRPVYLKIPKGMYTDGKTHALVLKKALYGLPDAPALWNSHLTKTLKDLGYSRCKTDWSLFKKETDGKHSFCAFHVDDGFLAATDQTTLQELLDHLNSKYEIKVDHTPSSYLKINFTKINNYFYLSQVVYIESLMKKFNLVNAKPISTPMDPGFITSPDISDSKPLDGAIPYRSLMGALLYIARHTRPDTLYAVSILCQVLHCPTSRHWSAAKRLLIYLYYTRHESLRIGPVNNTGLTCYSDATWADDPLSRKSRSGGVLYLDGSFISAWSKKQTTTALSSTESEYQALALALQDVLHFQQTLSELGFNQFSMPIYCDNQSAIALAVSTKNHPRVKHIAIKYHFIRDEIEKGTVKLYYVPTDQQIADIFTKPLAATKFNQFKGKLGLQVWRGVAM